MFITFEGGEGAGKSTQIRRLKERLEREGRAVVVTREPGGTPEAEKIRTLLVDRAGGDWSPIAETLLVFAARAMHVRDLIIPALKAGKTVLCDRFTDSTRAYQGYAGGIDLGVIEALKHAAADDGGQAVYQAERESERVRDEPVVVASESLHPAPGAEVGVDAEGHVQRLYRFVEPIEVALIERAAQVGRRDVDPHRARHRGHHAPPLRQGP